MLRVKDTPDNLAIPLMAQIADYGRQHVPVVIIEGILARDRYTAMLTQLSTQFDRTLAYYFSLSLDTTYARHRSKPNHTDFGQTELRRWWHPNDQLNFPHEYSFTGTDTLNSEVARVIADLHHP